MNPELGLYSLDAASFHGDWLEALRKRVDESPVEYDIRGNRLRIWDPQSQAQRTPRPDVGYRDGIQLRRINLGDRRDPPAIGLSICRLFFEADCHLPSLKSHAELFTAGSTPQVLRHIRALPIAKKLFETINGSNSILALLGGNHFTSLSRGVRFKFGDGNPVCLDELVAGSYSKRILSSIRSKPAVAPANLSLALIPAFSRNNGKAKQIATATSSVLRDEWACSVDNALLSDDRDLKRWLGRTADQNRIVLVALDSQKGERPSSGAIEWLTHLSEERVAFQLCSTQSNPLYTRHGLACSILAKAGGSPFTVTTESVPDLANHWCVGLDLGFGGQYEGKIAVITLTDGHGRLRAYWRALKDSDETIQQNVLQDGLTWIIATAESLEDNRKFLVLRDGMRPKNEKIGFYRELLPKGRATLVEYVKSGNPLFLAGDSAPIPGTLCIPGGVDTAFLYPATVPQDDVVGNTTKFFSSLNDLGYTLEQLGGVITALCHASKLSFQPSGLPAPIYWADGLASLSNSNLQFGGWAHLPNRTRDLRKTRNT